MCIDVVIKKIKINNITRTSVIIIKDKLGSIISYCIKHKTDYIIIRIIIKSNNNKN